LIVLRYLATLLACVLGAATPVAGGGWLWLAGRRRVPDVLLGAVLRHLLHQRLLLEQVLLLLECEL
jgi:hypothetical protein